MAVFERPGTIVKKSGKVRAGDEYYTLSAQAIIDVGVGIVM